MVAARFDEQKQAEELAQWKKKHISNRERHVFFPEIYMAQIFNIQLSKM